MIRDFANATPRQGSGVFIDDSAVVIGDVTLAKDVSIWPMCVVRGDVNSIEIGEATNIQDGSVLHVTHDGPYSPGGFSLSIGQGCTVGHQAMLHACRIEDYCLIGMGTIVLDGAHIESHVMLGAGSLVPPGKRLESGMLYVGSPIKPIRSLSSEEMDKLHYSAEHYVKLKNRYLSE